MWTHLIGRETRYRLPWWLSGKESACNVGAAGSHEFDPWVGKSRGGGHGNLLQYSCLENPMDWGAWKAEVHGVVQRFGHYWNDLAWQVYPVRKGNGFWTTISASLPDSSLIRNGMERKNHRYKPESPWIFPTRIRSIQFGLGASIALGSPSLIHSKLGFIGFTNYFLYLCKAAKWISLLFPNTFHT